MHNQRAYQFFKDLEQYLDQRIPPPETIRNEIDIVVRRARKSTNERHKAFPEGAFQKRIKRIREYLYRDKIKVNS